MQNNYEILIALFAITISIISLIISFFAYKTGKKSFDLNLVPILKINFLIDRQFRKYSLTLFNDGPNDINEIKIKLIQRLITQTFDPLVTIRSKNDWDNIKTLKKNKSQEFLIKNDILDNLIQSEKNRIEKGDKNLGFALTFQITFRREPDKKIFNESRTLFYYRDSKSNELSVFDPDEFGFDYWKNGHDKLNSIE